MKKIEEMKIILKLIFEYIFKYKKIYYLNIYV